MMLYKPIAGFHAGPLSWWNWNSEMLVFLEGGKPEYLEKNPRSKVRTNKLSYKWHWAGIKPRPHCGREGCHHWAITARQNIFDFAECFTSANELPLYCTVTAIFLIGNGHSLNRKTTKQPTHLPTHPLKWLETDVMGSYLSKIFSIGWENLHGQIKN